MLAEEQEAVGPGNPYREKTIGFQAVGAAAEVRFEGLATVGDQSLLLDNVRLFAGTGVEGNLRLHISLLGGNAVDIAWPASAPANFLLQSTTDVAQGPWRTLDAVPSVEGGLIHVLDAVEGPKKFYRLARP